MSAGVPEPLALAKHLLSTIESIYETPAISGKPALDPYAEYKAKIDVQRVCNELLIKVLGPALYTAQVAGECCSTYAQE